MTFEFFEYIPKYNQNLKSSIVTNACAYRFQKQYFCSLSYLIKIVSSLAYVKF